MDRGRTKIGKNKTNEKRTRIKKYCRGFCLICKHKRICDYYLIRCLNYEEK